jgi:hypothetical protein
MKPDTTLTLQPIGSGDVFEFARFEIPEQIPFGGDQCLTVHQMVGGLRVIDAMGATPRPVEWSGQFVGDTALECALYIDGLRKAGKPLYLSWDALAFNVVIKSFHCEFKRFYRIPYRITCEVGEDLTAPVDYIAAPSIDQLIADDLNTANGLASGIGDGALALLMGTLNSAISAVSSFAAAAQSVLNSVLQPIAAVRAQVGILIQATNGAILNVTTLGGVLPGNPIAQQANKLLGQINAVNQSPLLFNLDRALGRTCAMRTAISVTWLKNIKRSEGIRGGKKKTRRKRRHSGSPMALVLFQQEFPAITRTRSSITSAASPSTTPWAAPAGRRPSRGS